MSFLQNEANIYAQIQLVEQVPFRGRPRGGNRRTQGSTLAIDNEALRKKARTLRKAASPLVRFNEPPIER